MRSVILATFLYVSAAQAAPYVHTDANGIVEGPPYNPPSGVTIQQAFPPDMTWLDIAGVSPVPSDGWTCLAGPPVTCTAPVAPVVPPSLPTTVQIVSTGTPSLSGTYSIDATAISNITAITAGINAGQGFPGSGSSFAYLGADGAPHVFTDTSEFIAFGKAVRDFVYALDMYAMGQSQALPSQPVPIP